MSATSPARASRSPLRAITDRVVTRRGAVLTLLGWLLAAVVVSAVAPKLSSVTSSRTEDFLPMGAESLATLKALERSFPGADGIPGVVVYRRDGGLTAADRTKVVADTQWLRGTGGGVGVTRVAGGEDSTQLAAALRSPDGTTDLLSFTLPPIRDQAKLVDQMTALRDHIGRGGSGLLVRIGGPAGSYGDFSEVFKGFDTKLLFATGTLVLVLLALIYRAPALVLMPVIAVGWSYVIASGLVAIIARGTGLPVSEQATSILTVLAFGAGTDYTLFVLARYRDHLRDGEATEPALRGALRSVGGAVFSSGSTIVVSGCILLLATLGSVRNLGPVIAITIALTLCAGLTLIPAMLRILGGKALWPTHVRRGAAQQATATHRIWERVGRLVTTRTAMSAALAGVLLAVLASGMSGYAERFDPVDDFTRPVDSVDAFKALRQAFPAGELAPGDVVVEPASAAPSIAAALAADTRVAAVRPSGTTAGGSAAHVQVVLKGNPYGTAEIDDTADLRTVAHDAAPPGATVLYGGPSALQYDFAVSSRRDTEVLLPIMFVAVGLILATVLRALLLPVVVTLVNVLGFAAALGFIVGMEKYVLHSTGVSPIEPLYLFVFLGALGADYNIILLTRLREEAQRHGLREGARRAVAGTGGVITSAGVILAGTFMTLAVLPVRDLLDIGAGVAVGILLDTVVVRSLLVPSLVMLLGPRAWWPGRVLPVAATPAPVAATPERDVVLRR